MASQRRSATSFGSSSERFLASLTSASTRDAYRRDLEVYAAWTSAAGIAPLKVTTVEVEAYRLHCERLGSSAATVHRRMSALSSFFRYAAAAAPNPVDDAARPAPPDVADDLLSDREVAAIWVAASQLSPKTAAIVGLVLFEALKSSELLPLDVDDVDFGRSGGVVVAVARREQSVDRVAVDGRTATALRRYVGRRTAGPLFLGDNPTRPGARLTRFGVDYLVKRTGAAAGIRTPLTVNALRRNARNGGGGEPA